jgi:hypothetical protein
MNQHDALHGWPRTWCGLAAVSLMLFSFSPAYAAGASVSEGFRVKVTLLAADPKPIVGTPATPTPSPSRSPSSSKPPEAAVGGACTISNLKLLNSSQLNIACTAAEVIASRYYKMPAYNWFNAGQTAWVLPNQKSGIGLGTSSSLRVLHEPDDELIEVWVSW